MVHLPEQAVSASVNAEFALGVNPANIDMKSAGASGASEATAVSTPTNTDEIDQI